MTMPHLMNCLHSEDGWCLDCVKELWEREVSGLYDEIGRLREENERLRAHDFDLWLAEFEKFVAGQAERARDK